MTDQQPIIDSEKSSESSEDGNSVEVSRPFRLTLEPLVGAVMFAQSFTDNVLTQLFLKQTCEVQLKLNSSVCKALGTDTPLGHWAEAYVQPHAADYLMWKLMLQSILPAILSLFLGSWTDTHGRKPVIVFSMAGVSLMYACYTVLAHIRDLHPAFILLGIIPLSCMGGYVNLLSISYCYVTDINIPRQRPLRIGIIQGSLFGGILVGLYLSPILYNATEASGYGYLVIFGGAGLVCFLALLFTVLFVPESVKVTTQSSGGLTSVLNLQLPLDMLRTCFRPRANHKRTVLLLCMFVPAMLVLVQEGESQVTFLFTRLQFEWTLHEFSIFSTVFMIVTITGSMIGLWLIPKLMTIPDIFILLLAYVGNIMQCLLMGVATPKSSYLLYVAAGVAFLRGVPDPIIRTIMCNAVEPHESGKVFALTASILSVMPIAASPLYVEVYNASINVLPGAMFFLSAAFHLISVCAIIAMYVLQRRYWEQPPVIPVTTESVG